MTNLQKYRISRIAAFVLALTLALPALAGERINFSTRNIQEQLNILASDEFRGRGTGDIGNDRAAQYIAAEFARCGLKPLGTEKQRDITAPMDGSGYYQPFTVDAGRLAGKKSHLEVRFGEKTVNYRPRSEFEPSGISGSGKAEGEVVFVGYGISAPNADHDDYGNNVDVKGKIVLLLEGVPGNNPHSPLGDYENIYRKAFTAREKGATAVLAVRPKDSDTPSSGFDSKSDAGIPVLRVRYPMAERWLTAKNLQLDALKRDADTGKIVSTPTGAQAKIVADVEKVTKITANIIGLIEGSDPVLKNEFIVVGAHMDHLGLGGSGSLDASGKPAIHYGADDNASGTSGVLQLAARFGPKTAENGSVPRLKRSLVLMAFSGEEMGLLGSAHYCRAPLVPLDKTVAMLNMDMIGRLKDNRLILGGTGTAKEWDALIDAANRETYFQIARSEEGFGASDQQSFYLKDIPVLFFFTGVHSDYHRPSDTAEKINTAGLVRILQLVTTCVERIADAPARPTFQKIAAAAPSGSPSRGFPVSMGFMPDYAAGEEGVLVSDIIPGRAAEKAGIKKGDIIVKFGELDIKNVQDYTAALQNYKPGDVVEVVVKRNGEKMTFKVTLAASRR